MTTNRMGCSGKTAQRVVDAFAASPDVTMKQVAASVGTTVDYVRCIRTRRRTDIARKPGGNRHHGAVA